MEMRWSAGLVLLMVVWLGVVAPAYASSDVVVLESSTFDEVTAEGDWLLEFYAPWCGHCKSLAPTWEDLATQAKAQPGGPRVGKVDCTVNQDLCTRIGVRGYPTIRLLKEKQLYTFKGERKVESFLAFVADGYQTGESVPLPTLAVVEHATEADEVLSGSASDVQVLTAENFTLATSGDAWFVMFYAPWCGHCKKLGPTWDEAAVQLQGKARFAKLDCTANVFVCQLFDVRGYPTLLFFKGDDQVREYTGVREVSDLATFVGQSYQTADARPYPLPAFLMTPSVFKLYKVVEPLAAWVSDNVGAAFGIVTLLALVLGFLIGRLSVASEVRYVIPKELAPQWNELLARKRAHEERQQAKRDKRAQGKSTGTGGRRSSLSNPSSPQPRKRKSGKQNKAE